MQLFNKTILSIHAHPDDTEISCAGTLKLLKEKGYKIVIASMSGGGLGGINMSESRTVSTRISEARKAAAILGASYYCLHQRDGFVFDNPKARIALTEIIRKEEVGIVFTHLPFDYHCDHRSTCNIVEAATIVATLKNVPGKSKPLEITPLLYHTNTINSSDNLGNVITKPHFCVDITSAINTKKEMLSCHETQKEVMRVMHRMDDFLGEMIRQNQELGSQIGVKYAEAIWQHLGGGFQKDPVIQEELKKYLKYIK
jgi:N-acetylglucosamine malate deacetylase 1